MSDTGHEGDIRLLPQEARSALETILSTPQKRGRIKRQENSALYLKVRLEDELKDTVRCADIIFTLEDMRKEALERGDTRFAEDMEDLFSKMDYRDCRFRWGFCDCDTCES